METWNALDDPERKARLLNPRAPTEVLLAARGEAMQASDKGEITLEWEPSKDQPGCYRIVAKIPISKLLFDELFNSRSGYRAQYYLSVDAGRRYNRAIVDGLSPAIQELHGKLSGCVGAPRLLTQSRRRV